MSLTLRQVLFLPFVALVAVTALAIGALAYRSGATAIDDLSERTIRESVGRINQAVERHLYGSEAVLEAAFPNGIPAPPTLSLDLPALRTRLWVASSLHTDPNHYVYYGNEKGQFLGLDRTGPNEAEVRLKLDPTAHRTIYRIQGVLGAFDGGRPEEAYYDPRLRPWYKKGAEASSVVWTAVYIDFKTRELVSTRARRVLDAEGRLEGVVATDVSLRALNEFLASLQITDHGVAAVLEPNGQLIATSGGANLNVRVQDKPERLLATQAPEPLVRTAYQAMQDRIPRLTREQPMQVVRFDDEAGHPVFGVISRVRDDLGLDWVTLVAIPRDDVMGGIERSQWRALAIAALAILAALAIGGGILNWIARDLRRISEAAQRIGQGELDVPLDLPRQDEIGALGRAFMDMQHQLATDPLTGVNNRRGFRARLRRRLTLAAEGNAPEGFGVIFIDLDHFKRVNDVLGHAGGDAVLGEVAQRLRGCLGPDDTVARLGGDEFAVLLHDAPTAGDIQATLDRIAQRVSAPSTCTDPVVLAGTGFGISLGFSHCPTDGRDLDALLDAADRHMYSAKAQSRLRESQFDAGGAL